MKFEQILKLYETGKLNLFRTCNQRIDNCPTREVVHDLEEPWEREQRVRRRTRIEEENVR